MPSKRYRRRSDDLRSWFQAQLAPDGECVVWTGSRTFDGYGKFKLRGKSVYAHRWIYEELAGPIPTGLVVMHICDNPSCCRLEHLRIGSHKDNAQDAFAKGRRKTPARHRPPVLRGEENPRAKLETSDLDDIRRRYAAGENGIRIARSLGISSSTVYRVIHGTTWRHLEAA